MLKQVTQPVELEEVRKDFPVLDQTVNGYPLAYLDSAATAQKPAVVIDALDDFFRRYNANVHRGVYQLSEQATEAMEDARAKIQSFIGAKSAREIVFTRNTTEGINLAAQSWGRTNLHPGDRILLTGLEHHSNIVPWQLIGADIDVVPLTDDHRIDLDAMAAMIRPEHKLVALAHVSNVLGSVLDATRATEIAHSVGARLL